MKKILFTLLFIVAFLGGYTQLYNAGGFITVEANATLVIQGDYTCTSGGNLLIDGTVELRGDFINNTGTVDVNSDGLLIFNGTGAQEIRGTDVTTFNCDVEIDNGGSGVSLTTVDAILAKALALTDGKLTLNAFDLTVAASSVITADASNYIVTNSTGQMIAPVSNTDFIFPVGNASFNPLTLNEAGTADNYGVSFSDALPSGWTGTDHAVTGHWTVSEETSGGNNLSATAQWIGTQEQTNFARTDCAVGVSTDLGANFTWDASGAALGSNPYTRVGTGFNTVGTFMVGDYFFEGIDLDLDVMLAGPYSGGTMSIALKTAGLIPLTSPYDATSVSSIPANVVDWIQVELRDQTTPSTVVKSYSFFVDNNGNILNTTGSVGAKLTGATKNQYYVVVNHRNHLGAMTASTIDFTTVGPHTFDFKAGSGIYNSANYPMRNMGGGIYALWAGDSDGNGVIELARSTSDITPISSYVINYPGNTLNDPTIPTSPDYSNADTDMNGMVEFARSTSDITPISASVINNPANTLGDPTIALTEQLP